MFLRDSDISNNNLHPGLPYLGMVTPILLADCPPGHFVDFIQVDATPHPLRGLPPWEGG
jgi:hypothetical protein